MNYTKPEVVKLGGAISAVQSQGVKTKHTAGMSEIAFPYYFTVNAYEADE